MRELIRLLWAKIICLCATASEFYTLKGSIRFRGMIIPDGKAMNGQSREKMYFTLALGVIFNKRAVLLVQFVLANHDKPTLYNRNQIIILFHCVALW
jgi:hypothetical protein